jgi:hypothetical protein
MAMLMIKGIDFRQSGSSRWTNAMAATITPDADNMIAGTRFTRGV